MGIVPNITSLLSPESRSTKRSSCIAGRIRAGSSMGRKKSSQCEKNGARRERANETLGHLLAFGPAGDRGEREVDVVGADRLGELGAADVDDGAAGDLDLEGEDGAALERGDPARHVVAVGDVAGERHPAEGEARMRAGHEAKGERADLGDARLLSRLGLDDLDAIG